MNEATWGKSSSKEEKFNIKINLISFKKNNNYAMR